MRWPCKFTESDLAQETKLRALAAICDFRGITEKEFIGWLLVILENVAREFKRHYRAAKRDAGREIPLVENGEELLWFPDVFVSDVPDMATISVAELQKHIGDVMNELSETNRKVLHMIYWERRSFIEIAERLQMLPQDIRTIHDHATEIARKRLSDALGRERL